MPTLSELQQKSERGTTSGDLGTSPGVLTMSDLGSLPRQELETFDVGGVINISDDQRKKWRNEKPMGWVEQWERTDKTEMIPFNPERAIKSASLLKMVNRLKKDQYNENPSQKQKDLDQVNAFLFKTAEEKERGFTIGGRINQGVTALPGFMVEFLATGGVAAVGKKAATTAITKTLGKAAQTGAAKVATKVAGVATGAVARTAAMPQRVAAGFSERQLNSSLELTSKGFKVAEESFEKPHISFAKAIGDVTIENFSEVTGPALSAGVSRLVPKKFTAGLSKLWSKLHPSESVTKLATKAGYNGFLEELGEERVGALMRATFGVEDFGAENPERMFDRIVASIPDGEELLVEAGVLAFPGAVNVGAQQTMRVINARRTGKEVTVEPETPAQRVAKEAKAEEISEEIAEQILTAPAEVVAAERKEVVPKPAPTLSQKLERIDLTFRTTKGKVKQTVKAVQTEVIKTLEESTLTANDKAKFIRTLKNIQTEKQFLTALPKIKERVGKLETQAQVQGLKSKINKILKRTKPVIVAGKPKGKFGDPAIQRILDQARTASKMTQAQAQTALTELNKDLTGVPSSEQALQNRILGLFAGLEESRDPVRLAAIAQELDALTSTGRAISELERMDRKAREDKLVDDALEVIIGDRPPDPAEIPNKLNQLGKSLRTFGKSLSGWDDVMDILSQDDPTSRAGESKLSKAMSVTQIEQKEKGAVRKSSERFINLGLESFGFAKETELLKRFREDAEQKNLGRFTNTAGEEVVLILSKSQARKRWMEFQDPTLVRTLIDPKANAYSPEMIETVNNFLTQEDVTFAKAQLKFYRQFYNKINKVYTRIYGIDLPFNEFYSPISREAAKETVADSFIREIQLRRSVAPGSLIGRVENIRPIRDQSDVGVIQRHIIEMEHFMSWVDKIRDIEAVFTDNSVRKVIEQKFGQDTQSVINGFIRDFTRGGVERAQAHQKWADWIRTNFTVSALALKPALTLKQTVSMFAFSEFVPTTEYFKGVLDLAVNTNAKLNLLRDSELMKARGKSITRDIKDAMKSKEFQLFKENNKFRNMLLFTTRLGDRGAILLGGWSVYRYNKEVLGKTHEQSLAAFEKATAATQQSGDLSQLSQWQRGTPIEKLFTMFTSAQNQYFRRMVGAIRNVGAGRITAKEFGKKIFIYNFLLPILFQFVSQIGRWDEEEAIVTGALGSFNGMFILGDIFDVILRTAFIEFADFDIDKFDPSIPPLESYRAVERSLFKFADAVDAADVMEAIKDLSAGAIGPTVGLPIKQILDFYEGGSDIISDKDIKSGSLKLMGWSPYIVNKRLEE